MPIQKRSKTYHIVHLAIAGILATMALAGAFTKACNFAFNCLLTWPIGILLFGVVLAYIFSLLIKSYLKSFILSAVIVILTIVGLVTYSMSSEIKEDRAKSEQERQNKARVEQLIEFSELP